jgi:uncharacterized protein
MSQKYGSGVIRYTTIACYGYFPNRIVFEAFCVLLDIYHINNILAVSEHCHVFR